MKYNKFYINKMIDFEVFLEDSKIYNTCILCISQLEEISKKFDEEFFSTYNFVDWHL